MAYIYKITNDINNKIYVGKTNFNIEKRFKEHCRDALKENVKHRPLYAAMRKYSIQHFYIELIEETDIPEEREKFWIKQLNSYSSGYNATLGGDGKQLIDYAPIIARLKEHPYPSDVAKEFNCSKDTVCNIAKEYHIPVKNKGNVLMQEKLSKKIAAYTKTGDFIALFPSTVEAGRWCYAQGKALNYNSGVRSHISDAAKGKRKTAYGYIWKYV